MNTNTDSEFPWKHLVVTALCLALAHPRLVTPSLAGGAMASAIIAAVLAVRYSWVGNLAATVAWVGCVLLGPPAVMHKIINVAWLPRLSEFKWIAFLNAGGYIAAGAAVAGVFASVLFGMHLAIPGRKENIKTQE